MVLRPRGRINYASAAVRSDPDLPPLLRPAPGRGETGRRGAVQNGCNDPGRHKRERRQKADVAFGVAVATRNRGKTGDMAGRQFRPIDALAIVRRRAARRDGFSKVYELARG
jgi:hypothetical protein